MPQPFRGALVVALPLVVASGCSRPPVLNAEPIELSTVPRLVRFESAFACAGPRCELWFEFELPGASEHADSIRVELVSATDQRYGLAEPEFDRRGEALVSVAGTLVARDPGAPPAPASVTFLGAELSAETPLSLRALRGACGE